MNVHGIMNTLGLLQSKWRPASRNYARDPKYSWFHEQTKNWIFIAYVYILFVEIIYNLGNETVVFCFCFLLKCKTERRNSQCEHRQPMAQTGVLFCTCDSGVSLCTFTATVALVLLVNEFDAYCTRANLCYSLGYERLQTSKDSLKACFENVNIYETFTNDMFLQC